MRIERILAIALAVAMLWATSAAAGLTDEQKCEAFKIKHAGKYAACLMKAESIAVKKGVSANYEKCDGKLSAKFLSADDRWACPAVGDVQVVRNLIVGYVDVLAGTLGGERFVDNGDETVTDTQTGLMWEQKDDNGGIHDKDNTYTWGSVTPPYESDGTAFLTFLAALNGGDGPNTCFAGHCDWRLPTSEELQTILLEPYPCGTNPCIDPIFGPTQPYLYWSATAYADNPTFAWGVIFFNGQVTINGKTETNSYVRAVRGGS